VHGLEQHGDAFGIVAAVERARRDRLVPGELGLDQRVGERSDVAALGGSGRGQFSANARDHKPQQRSRGAGRGVGDSAGFVVVGLRGTV